MTPQMDINQVRDLLREDFPTIPAVGGGAERAPCVYHMALESGVGALKMGMDLILKQNDRVEVAIKDIHKRIDDLGERMGRHDAKGSVFRDRWVILGAALAILLTAFATALAMNVVSEAPRPRTATEPIESVNDGREARAGGPGPPIVSSAPGVGG